MLVINKYSWKAVAVTMDNSGRWQIIFEIFIVKPLKLRRSQLGNSLRDRTDYHNMNIWGLLQGGISRLVRLGSMQEFDTLWYIMIQWHNLIVIIRWYDMMWFGNSDNLMVLHFQIQPHSPRQRCRHFVSTKTAIHKASGLSRHVRRAMWCLKRKWDQVLTCQ